MLEKNTLRLDIGNSFDMIGYSNRDLSVPQYTFGADFFTFTRIQSEQRFHFPVDAVDYLFGLNASTAWYDGGTKYSTRFRLSHISAHLVDGHYDNNAQEWKGNQSPRVYSREFVELIGSIDYRQLVLPVRVYGGVQYLFHVDPKNVGKFSAQAGIEANSGDHINQAITAYAALDVQAVKVYVQTIRTSIEAGIKLGRYYGRGLNIYYAYFDGMSMNGEYFDRREEYNAVGIRFEF